MLRMLGFAFLCVAWCSAVFAAESLPELPPIPRRLPAKGIPISEAKRKELREKLAPLVARVEKLPEEKHRPDVEVLTKAVDYALRFGEFYNEKDFAKADWALKLAEERLDQAEKGEFPWLAATGLVVRGYRSRVDGSVQPYGLVIPAKEKYDPAAPLYVWLHGRGEQVTDLHFLHGRAHSVGDIAPEKSIVVHPFGRQCIGWKSAGEIDVIAVVRAVEKDRWDKTQERKAWPKVLMGFSMGGAGAWHIAAHYPWQWNAVGAGAGFAETAKFMKYNPSDYPPEIEQTMWRVYDVPDYVRNLFSLPVIAYSGEMDGQIQAARVMEAAYKAHGKELPHLIGPKTAHSIHPETKKEWLAKLEQAAIAKDSEKPGTILQTRTLRYGVIQGLRLLGLEKHWSDSRVDIQMPNPDSRVITTTNVSRLAITRSWYGPLWVTLDGQDFMIGPPGVPPPPPAEMAVRYEKKDGKWRLLGGWVDDLDALQPGDPLLKRPRLQGPIDDAFLDPFLVVAPSGKSTNPLVERWVKFELDHLVDRWRAVFRGELRIKKDTEVTDDDLKKYHVVCWGDFSSNKLLARMQSKLPLAWSDEELSFRGNTYDAVEHVPVFIYPNPLRPGRYVVVNSGPTFREFDDANNSLQNPKLGDWAVIDLRVPPNNRWPGKVVAAGFFDEEWK